MELFLFYNVFIFRQALNEAKKQNYNLLERVQTLQNENSENEVRRAEIEGQLRQSHGVSQFLYRREKV